jgi:hypothetical protein
MGLKGYRLWVMGQLDSNVQRPTAQERVPAVAAKVAFENPNFETGFPLR